MKFAVVVLIFSLLTIPSCSPSNKDVNSGDLLVISGSTMGTTFTVKIVKNNFLKLGDVTGKIKIIKDSIEELLGNVNRQMSTYIPDSEISLFNLSGKDSWFSVSHETAYVLSNALRISKVTNGTFDITVGPLINLWGFGPGNKPKRIPGEDEIENAKKKTGYFKLSVRIEPPEVKKSDPEIYCDLSAIAKGYGVDKVASFLDSEGFYNYMVEIGGEISVRGKNGKGEEWRLGVLSPDGSESINSIISIGDLAMATSGDYHNYFEEDGVRYSHTIDPETGRPIIHKLVSVSVVHKSCMEADALATAIDVMGPQKGYEFALSHSLPVYMIIREGKVYKEKMTPEFSVFPIEKGRK